MLGVLEYYAGRDGNTMRGEMERLGVLGMLGDGKTGNAGGWEYWEDWEYWNTMRGGMGRLRVLEEMGILGDVRGIMCGRTVLLLFLLPGFF